MGQKAAIYCRVSTAEQSEFEKDLLRGRVKVDKLKNKVIELVQAGHPYRQIGQMLDISKNTVLSIVKRERDLGKA